MQNPTYSVGSNTVRVSGIDIGFIDWVVLLVKLSLASIPAMIIVSFVLIIIGLIFSALLAGIFAGAEGALGPGIFTG